MAQQVIIHTASRVIRRITTDVSPVVASDETAIVMASPLDIGGGFWKLDVSNNKVAATAAEAQTAGIDENFKTTQRANLLAAYKTALINAIASTTTANIQAVFQSMKNLP